MAKKKTQPAEEKVEVVTEEVKVAEDVKTEEPKVEKKVKDKKKETKIEKETKVEKSKSKSKPKKEKKSMKKKVQEVVSELKKVSKPSFGKVCKDTCVVIAVVAICTLLLFGVDKLFSLVNNLLLPN